MVESVLMLLMSLRLDVVVEAVPLRVGEVELAERHCGQYPSLVQLRRPVRDGSLLPD